MKSIYEMRSLLQFGKRKAGMPEPTNDELFGHWWANYGEQFAEMEGELGHSPGHRTWIQWKIDLSTGSPRRQILPDCMAYGRADEPPTGMDCWRTDGFESSLGYLLDRRALKPGELERLTASLPVEEMADILDWWRHPGEGNHPEVPLHAYELAVVMRVWDPEWKHDLLTAEEFRRAMPYLDGSDPCFLLHREEFEQWRL